MSWLRRSASSGSDTSDLLTLPQQYLEGSDYDLVLYSHEGQRRFTTRLPRWPWYLLPEYLPLIGEFDSDKRKNRTFFEGLAIYGVELLLMVFFLLITLPITAYDKELDRTKNLFTMLFVEELRAVGLVTYSLFAATWIFGYLRSYSWVPAAHLGLAVIRMAFAILVTVTVVKGLHRAENDPRVGDSSLASVIYVVFLWTIFVMFVPMHRLFGAIMRFVTSRRDTRPIFDLQAPLNIPPHVDP